VVAAEEVAMLTWFIAAAAFAHIGLEDPQARYPSDGSNNNKACPCGVGNSNRTCDDPSDYSDPDRNESRASTFQAGETITLTFYETIGHAGRYRIAFDPDGADLPDFNDNILLDVPDPPGSAGNTGDGDKWEFEVTLPDMACDNCTLQLVQMMDGNTDDPVPDPAGRSSYYQCIDLVLLGEGGTPPTPTTDDAGDDTGELADDDEARVGDSGGCGCSGGGTPPSALGLLALGLLVRRRR
jgi:MYXO-CTERM domain-containing protein